MPWPAHVISGKLYAGPEVDVWSYGVILYALLRGSLPFDDENFPNLSKKIKGGIYTLPSHLSPRARDLIPRMLLVDPMKRMTIPEIRQHAWFLNHLPRYLAVPPPDTNQQAKRIDEETLKKVVTKPRTEQGDCGLLLDRQRSSHGYIGSEFDEAKEQMVCMSPRSPMDAYGGTPRSGYHRTPTPSMDRRGLSSPLQQRVVAERK